MKPSRFPDKGSDHPARGFRDLVVWQRGLELVVESYRLAARLPHVERFALADQIRRASVSVPANIAEGHGRLGRPDFVRHLSIARGSLKELEVLLEIAERVGYLPSANLQDARRMADEVSRMLAAMIRSLAKPPLP